MFSRNCNLLLLLLALFSPGNSQPTKIIVTGVTGEDSEKNYFKSCDKSNEIVLCNIETKERFGCCFKQEAESRNHKWDYYEDIRGEPKNETLIPIEYCDPSLPIDGQCNVEYKKPAGFPEDETFVPKSMKTFYKEQQGVDVMCAALTPIEVDGKTYAGRCRSVKERQVLKSDFYGKTLHRRSDWALKKFLKNRRRKDGCNLKEFQKKGIRDLIERYLLCPFDTEYLDKEFHKLLEDAYFLPRMLEDLCLASPNLEECVPKEEGDPVNSNTGKCVCFSQTWKIRRSKDEVFVWNITQLEEQHKCTQAAGNPCTFNANDMIALQNTLSLIPKSNPKEEHSPHLLYGQCDVKGDPISKMEILPDLLCEQDAACESVLEPDKKCHAAKDCKCICAEGWECSRKNGQSRNVVKSFWSFCIIVIMTMRFFFGHKVLS